jgi:hypothetical protein
MARAIVDADLPKIAPGLPGASGGQDGLYHDPAYIALPLRFVEV